MLNIKKSLAYLWARSFGVLSLPSRYKVPILCYHSVNDQWNSDADPLTTCLFERHLDFITSKYNVISLDSFVDSFLEGKPVQKGSVVITFDDGYIDNYKIVFPLIKKFNIPITIFVVTGLLDRAVELIDDNHWSGFDWIQAAEMVESGLISIQAHTNTHPILSSLSLENAVEEVVVSKDKIEKNLGVEVRHFAYPNGQIADVPVKLKEKMASLGFVSACSTLWRTTHLRGSEFMLNRVMIYSSDDINTLQSKINGDYDYLFFVHLAKSKIAKFFHSKKSAYNRS